MVELSDDVISDLRFKNISIMVETKNKQTSPNPLVIIVSIFPDSLWAPIPVSGINYLKIKIRPNNA